MSELLATALGSSPTDGPGEHNAAEPDKVITLSELAEMLKINEPAVMERVAAGELPGRRFGDQWRFSRLAVLRWLDGTDADRPGPGFKVGR